MELQVCKPDHQAIRWKWTVKSYFTETNVLKIFFDTWYRILRGLFNISSFSIHRTKTSRSFATFLQLREDISRPDLVNVALVAR
jgi:hypothetical protein